MNNQPIRVPYTVVRIFDFYLVFTAAGVVAGIDQAAAHGRAFHGWR